MHILLIHQFFLEDQEGGGSRWNEMSRIWTDNGHQVTVLAGMVHYMGIKSLGYQRKFIVKTINKNHVNVIRCYVPDNYNSDFKGRLSAYFSFTFFSIWAGLFYATEKYDLILATSPPLSVGLTAVVISKCKNLPIVFEVRDLWPESAIDAGVLSNKVVIRLAQKFEKYLYRKAKLINVLTPAFKNVLVQDKSVPDKKIMVIPNAADFSMADNQFDVATFRKANDLENKFVVTYVGAHGVANHLIQILDTAEILQETNAYFLLIGNGMKKRELMEVAEKRNLSNVRFMNVMPKQDVLKYISASDAGASVLKKAHTFKTIYSNKTFDYFSCKKPVFMLIDGISRQLIEDADAGTFVEPENSVEFAEKIRYYMANPELVRKQGENGYRYARAHFDRDVLARQYLASLTAFRNI